MYNTDCNLVQKSEFLICPYFYFITNRTSVGKYSFITGCVKMRFHKNWNGYFPIQFSTFRMAAKNLMRKACLSYCTRLKTAAGKEKRFYAEEINTPPELFQ